jgi:hypothetical protein
MARAGTRVACAFLSPLPRITTAATCVLPQPGWVDLTDMNIAAAEAAAGSPEAVYYQSPKCLFCLILQPSAGLRDHFLRFGAIRAYLVLKLANLDAGQESFAAQQPLVPMDNWGYYWEKCRRVPALTTLQRVVGARVKPTVP